MFADYIVACNSSEAEDYKQSVICHLKFSRALMLVQYRFDETKRVIDWLVRVE